MMKSSSETAIFNPDDDHPLFSIGQARTEREKARQDHKVKLALAVSVAQASVMNDTNMKRLPHIRWRMTECAAHHAMSGVQSPPVMDLRGVIPADIEIVNAALLRAVAKVKKVLARAF